MKKYLSFIVLLFVSFSANAFTLTQAQMNLVKHDLNSAALSIADATTYYNSAATPAAKSWISRCDAQTLDEGANYSTFDSLLAGKQRSWAIYLTYAPRDMNKAKNRNLVTDVWGAATASSIAESILQAGTRNITNLEKLLGGATTATTGTVTALKLTYEGTITQNDMLDIREFGI